LPASVTIGSSLFETGIIRNLDTVTHTARGRFWGFLLAMLATDRSIPERPVSHRSAKIQLPDTVFISSSHANGLCLVGNVIHHDFLIDLHPRCKKQTDSNFLFQHWNSL
jgi:hypothetical protein